MCLYMLLYMAIEFFGICLVYIEASNLTDILLQFPSYFRFFIRKYKILCFNFG